MIHVFSFSPPFLDRQIILPFINNIYYTTSDKASHTVFVSQPYPNHRRTACAKKTGSLISTCLQYQTVSVHIPPQNLSCISVKECNDMLTQTVSVRLERSVFIAFDYSCVLSPLHSSECAVESIDILKRTRSGCINLRSACKSPQHCSYLRSCDNTFRFKCGRTVVMLVADDNAFGYCPLHGAVVIRVRIQVR